MPKAWNIHGKENRRNVDHVKDRGFESIRITSHGVAKDL
jgi:hypothetical protein